MQNQKFSNFAGYPWYGILESRVIFQNSCIVSKSGNFSKLPVSQVSPVAPSVCTYSSKIVECDKISSRRILYTLKIGGLWSQKC